MVKVTLNYENEIKDRGRILILCGPADVDFVAQFPSNHRFFGRIVAVRIVVRGNATSERSSTTT